MRVEDKCGQKEGARKQESKKGRKGKFGVTSTAVGTKKKENGKKNTQLRKNEIANKVKILR